MKNQENPRFIQNTPHGVDKYEGKSAERVADAIKSHIEEYNDKDNLRWSNPFRQYLIQI